MKKILVEEKSGVIKLKTIINLAKSKHISIDQIIISIVDGFIEVYYHDDR